MRTVKGAGIAIFENVCSKNSLTCTWKTEPFSGDSVRFTLSKGGQELRIRLGREFVADLPGTKEFQSALELYLAEVALRFGEPNFEEYAGNRILAATKSWRLLRTRSSLPTHFVAFLKWPSLFDLKADIMCEVVLGGNCTA